MPGFLIRLGGALAAALFALAAAAQPALKMMIPANPGGGWDQTGRNLAAAMQSGKLVSGVQFDNKAARQESSAWRNSSIRRRAIRTR